MPADYEASIEITENVYLIRGENRARFPEANALLVDDEILTLVDAGASLRNIEHALRNLNHEIRDIDKIILTHFHVDHKGHAAEIMRVAECELISHPIAKKGIESLEGTIEYYGIKGHPYFASWMQLIDIRLPHVVGNYNVTGYFNDNKPISLGNTELVPIHAPGHTEDHTVFGINGTEILFLVDIDLTRFGPWYGNAVSDIQKFKDSITRIINLGPMIGISSHLLHPVETDLVKRLEEYRAIFDEREQRIINNIKEGYNNIESLARKPTIYPRIPADAYLIFEEFMLRKHIEDMASRGILEIHGDTIVLI